MIMPHYTELEMFQTLDRLVRIYLESWPNDQPQLERFLRWAHHQYGYEHGKTHQHTLSKPNE
jgi:hypothetical protein